MYPLSDPAGTDVPRQMSDPTILQHFDPTYDFARDRCRIITEIDWGDGTVTQADAVVVTIGALADPTGPIVERITAQARMKAQAIIGRGR